MPTCEICGKKTKKLYKIRVEGAELLVCEDCKKYGELVGEVKERKEVIKPKKIKVEKEEEVVPEYYKIIRNTREKLKLKQEEFAKMIGIKGSLLKRIEDGKKVPSLDLARKIEKMFDVKLIEEVSFDSKNVKNEEKELTLGDVVVLKRRNK